MALMKIAITQPGGDVDVEHQILTGLTVDGKLGWQIDAMRVDWFGGDSIPDGNTVSLNVSLATQTGDFRSTDDEYLAGVDWYFTNSPDPLANYFEVTTQKDYFPLEPRVTVQPELVLKLQSSGTGAAQTAYVTIQYQTVKLSDIEVLRLMAAGA